MIRFLSQFLSPIPPKPQPTTPLAGLIGTENDVVLCSNMEQTDSTEVTDSSRTHAVGTLSGAPPVIMGRLSTPIPTNTVMAG